MKKLLTLSFLLLAIAFGCFPKAISEKDVDSILRRLDNELDNRDEYLELRQHTIDSLRNALVYNKDDKKSMLDVLFRLGDAYSAFNTDSAVIYFNHGRIVANELGEDSIGVRFALKEATFLPLLAFNGKAADILDSIDESGLPPGLKGEYYDACRQMNFYIATYFVDYPEVYEAYMAKVKDAQMKLTALLDLESPQFKQNQGEYFFYRQEYSKSKAILSEMLEQISEENYLYARACHFLADIAKARGEHHEYTYYLALSAIADIRSATLEVASLQELGKIMYLNNDVERAHDYLSMALRNAVDCHAPLRMIQSARALPIIENAHKAQLKASRNRIYIIIAIMGVLLGVLAVTMGVLRRKIAQMNRLATRLEDANRTKDVYITQFLNLCSIYMDKLSQFSKIVSRKISAGKVDDLYKLTKSGKFVEEQSKEFYDIFDDAFLHIYPSFVGDVNRLLRPEEQIVLKEGEKLNTDLRILAFMRLGIEESAKIAQMLNYSVYTIYTYRNKLKNRAISREDFEENVMKIKSIS